MGKGCRVVLEMGVRNCIKFIRVEIGAKDRPHLGEWNEKTTVEVEI